MKQEEFIRLYADRAPIPLDDRTLGNLRAASVKDEADKREYRTDREGLGKDVSLFFDLLRYAYSGYPYFAERADFDAIRDSLLASLPDQADAAWLRDALYEALRDVIVDAHFVFRGGHRFDRPVRAYFTGLTVGAATDGYAVLSSECAVFPVGAILSAEALRDCLFETLPSPDGGRRFLVGVLSDTPRETLDLGGIPVLLHPCRTDGFENPGGAWSEWEDEGVKIAHDASFDGGWVRSTNESLGKSGDAHFERGLSHRKDPALVWSLLGNTGGDSRYPKSFIRGLNGYANWQSDCAVSEIAQDGDRIIVRWSLHASERTDPGRSEYSGRLFVLQNKKTASSGEAAVCFARSVKGAVFIGSATMGCGQFGDLNVWRLPCTGVTFAMGYKVFQMDGFEEGRGLLPDYWLDSKTPWEDVCRWIRDCGLNG